MIKLSATFAATEASLQHWKRFVAKQTLSPLVTHTSPFGSLSLVCEMMEGTQESST